MPFNPSAFGSGFAGGADTAASGAGAFDAGGFGAGFYGGSAGGVTTGGAFDSAGFGSGFYGGANTSTGGTGGPLSPADIAAIAVAVRASMSAELAAMLEVWRIHGLDASAPLNVTPTSRTAGTISQTISGNGTTTSTVSRA